ncbi:MAG: sulfurtransferase [Gammaproteobacteria bacterium]|nr:sulfurtransferase [Gammaproteobacteria bacterium]MCY4219852.1 sulfurtransferase [Gammaproteobacteria bacterium]MCY4275159.1 sulfurtransferase [Gammaproteobacteria bacterium]
MNPPFHPNTFRPELVIRPQELVNILNDRIRIVDLRPDSAVNQDFIPGAIRLDYGQLIRKAGMVEGMLPELEALTALISSLGIDPDTRVIAYDENSGIRATRLLWTLYVCSHQNVTLLDGGIKAWKKAGLPIETTPAISTPKPYTCTIDESVVAELDHVMDSLDNHDRCILDVRSYEEYIGNDIRAKRGGHIPSACIYEWDNVLDDHNQLRNPDEILAELLEAGVDPKHEIIPYCQSHRRSAHMFHILKWLGYPRVCAYHGSWSEWGNSESTPIET